MVFEGAIDQFDPEFSLVIVAQSTFTGSFSHDLSVRQLVSQQSAQATLDQRPYLTHPTGARPSFCVHHGDMGHPVTRT
jgi:hypothetical protein